MFSIEMEDLAAQNENSVDSNSVDSIKHFETKRNVRPSEKGQKLSKGFKKTNNLRHQINLLN